MSKLSCIFWSIALTVSTIPWIVATLLCWIYTEKFETEPENAGEPKVGWIVSILHTVSPAVYLTYIPIAVVFIGLVGRRSLFSFCCLVTGVPVFAVVPIVVGGTLLYVAVSASSEEEEGTTGRGVGIAAGVTCLLSTVACLFVVCWAMICGSKGRGKEHQFPTPLAYFPFLKDFQNMKSEVEVADSERYTADYPPPRYTYSERKPISKSSWTSSRSSDKALKATDRK